MLSPRARDKIVRIPEDDSGVNFIRLASREPGKIRSCWVHNVHMLDLRSTFDAFINQDHTREYETPGSDREVSVIVYSPG